MIELNNNNNSIQHFKRTSNIQTSSETICYDHSILEMYGESLFGGLEMGLEKAV